MGLVKRKKKSLISLSIDCTSDQTQKEYGMLRIKNGICGSFCYPGIFVKLDEEKKWMVLHTSGGEINELISLVFLDKH